MNCVDQDHPTESILIAIGLGQLNEEELADIDGHLANCAACCEVVEGVAPDTLVALLRSAATDVAKTESPLPGAAAPAALNAHPRYRVGELLGFGGMGAVYKAEHLLMERPVALKVLKRELIDRPATMERFRREVRAAARLTHPNIVAAFDAEQVEDVHFLVMEYVEGVSLAKRSAEQGPLPVAEACDYIRQAALGLQHAHSCGMVHRDIKPQNLMLTPSGQVKILDFGLARFILEGREARDGEIREGSEVGSEEQQHSSGILHSSPIATRSSPLITDTGLTMGTPDYIAPEQARDSRVADIRADIYSLGCTLYDLLAGHAPFPDGSATQKVKAHLERTPAPLRSLRRDVPVELARVVERMMAKDPAARYQTPAEVAAALERFVKPKTPSRKRWLGLVAPLGFVAALVAGVIIYVQTDHGTIMVETNDDKIAVMIEKAGGVKIIDKTNNREYSLRPGAQQVPGGDYQIEVSEALAGLDFQTKEFKLRRGKEVRLTAKFGAKGEGQAVRAAVGVDRKRGEERLKILRTIVSQLEEQHKRGATDFEKVMQAERDVAKAEVELAQSEQEKVKALESLAAHAQKLVDVRKVQFEAGMATQVELLQAKGELLEAQAALERAKSNAGAIPEPPHVTPSKAWIKDWGFWIDPDRDCTFDTTHTNLRDVLSIKIPGKPHILSTDIGKTNAPRVLRRVEGDFAVEVTVGGAFPSNTSSLVEARWPFYGAGLLVWQDDKNYLRLARGRLRHPDDGWHCYANWQGHRNGNIAYDLGHDNLLVEQIPTTFRIKRMGDTFTASYNQGGKEWTTLLPIKSDLGKKLEVGVTAMQNTPAGYKADFENLKFLDSTAVSAPPNPLGKKTERANNKVDGPLYGGKPAQFWLDQLKDANPGYRAQAVQALGHIAQQDKQFIPVVIGILSDKSENVTAVAVSALSALGSDAIPALLDVLKTNKSALAKARAAVILGRIGFEAKGAVPLLTQELKSDDWGVRLAAIHGLGHIGRDAQTAIPAVVNVYGDFVKNGPLDLLNKAKTYGIDQNYSGSFTDLVFENLAAMDSSFMKAASKELRDLRLVDSGANADMSRFYNWLKKRYPMPEAATFLSPNSQSGAAERNESLYRGKPASYWLEQLKDGDPKFRAEAVEALGSMAHKNKALIPVLVAALKDEGRSVGIRGTSSTTTVATKAADALASLGPQAVPALLEVLKDKKSPTAVSHASYALGLIGQDAKAAVPVLTQALIMEDWNVRVAAITALGRMGAEAKPAVPTMVDVLGAFLKVLEQNAENGNREEPFPGAYGARGGFGNHESFPVTLFSALGRIDPEVQKIIPDRNDSVLNTGEFGPRQLLQLQRTYRALKNRYPQHQTNNSSAGEPKERPVGEGTALYIAANPPPKGWGNLRTPIPNFASIP